MNKALTRKIVVFGLIFFNLLVIFDWVQFGFGPPQGIAPKLVTTVIATVLYGGVLVWLNHQNKGD